MCGFLGVFRANKSVELSITGVEITQAMDVIKHRGPDDTSTTSSVNYHIGFNRLSINDLSKMMINLSNNENEIIYKPKLEGDIESSKADMELTKKLINWSHEIDLKEGLTELIVNNNYLDKTD